MSWNGDVDWGYIIWTYDAELVKAEMEGCEESDAKLVIRRKWLSPARIDLLPEFDGW